MAAFSSFQLVYTTLVIFLLTLSSSDAKTSFKPSALVLPVTQDASTLQYTTHIYQRTPLIPIKVVIDLGGQVLSIDCENSYASSTFHVTNCSSPKCTISPLSVCSGGCITGPKPTCEGKMCFNSPHNPFVLSSTPGFIFEDVLSIQSTNGSIPGRNVTIPRFVYTCGSNATLIGLASDSLGIIGLGRTKTALYAQLSSAFSLPKKFAICLAPSYMNNGVLFFGDGPYMMLPKVDISNSLTYTPFIINPNTVIDYFNGPSKEYFIGVKSIIINKRTKVSFKKSLLSIDSKGYGGTKITTSTAYTTLHNSIYKAFSKAFIKEAHSMGIKRVASVAPFEVCFDSKNVNRTNTGPVVPTIDLVLQNKNVVWRIYGVNSMVDVAENVLCLGFMDGGEVPRTSIVLGGYQLENNLLQFDLVKSRLGFSSSLSLREVTCSNFDFESKA